jgi:hypothetical protein
MSVGLVAEPAQYRVTGVIRFTARGRSYSEYPCTIASTAALLA